MAEDKTPKGDINFEFGQGITGLNMDNIPSQIGKGSLSYALNAALENFDNNSVTYQNEPGTEFCLNFPHNYVVIGRYFISEQAKKIFFLANPATGQSEIGYEVNNDCVYHTLINADCLNFDVNHPIHKVVHKTGNCGTEIYWAQTNADSRRYLNLDKIPYLPTEGSTPCDPSMTNQLDCNQLRVQPIYSIPQLFVKDVMNGGNLIAGTYQFAFQYSDAMGNPLSNYHSVTNPTPIADIQLTTNNFNYQVGKAIVLDVSNIELGGQFTYFNIAVIKTINNITSVELVGTFPIEGASKSITYSGQNVTQIRLTINDIFEQFPIYGPADDVTTAQDVLIWKGLSTAERVNYQKIANQIVLLWETYRIPPGENYADELNATNLRGYLRDEIYPFEIVYLLTSGRYTDAFHIPGRRMTTGEENLPVIPITDNDFIEDPELYPDGAPYWKIYNTAQVLGFSDDYEPDVADYKGPHQYGSFAYWESDTKYSCDKEMWGDLADTPIRHHKFPDVEISPIIECKTHTAGAKLEMGNVAVFPIGVKVDSANIRLLIESSDLTAEQKADIVGYKIVRGDRTDNRSIVAKGILRNVNKYEREKQTFYYANYPYNDLNADVFLNSANNAYQQIAKTWLVVCTASGKLQFQDPNTNKPATMDIVNGQTYELCSITRPIYVVDTGARATIGPAEYDVYHVSLLPAGADAEGFELKWTDPFSSENTSSTLRSTNMNYHIFGSDDDEWCRVAVGDGVDTSGCNSKKWFFECKQDTDKQDNPKQPLNTIDLHGGSLRNPHIGRRSTLDCSGDIPISPIASTPDLAYRQIFNSPETSFGQPFLGDVLKLESVMFGAGQAHFVEVKDNAKYRLLSREAQIDALDSAHAIAKGDITAMFTAYQAYLEIYINGITRKNYAYSFNSIADYNYCVAVPDGQGVKQRRLDLKKYLIPANQSVEEGDVVINNYQRETSVYLRTDDEQAPLLFPHLSPNMAGLNVRDISRFIVGCAGGTICGTGTTTTTTTIIPSYCPGSCSDPAKKQYISVVSYYAAIKNTFRGQWGQMYSYQTIDTGFQVDFDSPVEQPTTVFGGDTFICRFAFKTKLPFFIDNRVGAPDDSEIFYDELGNIAYPKFWHSARSILEDYHVPNNGGTLTNIISYKAHNFDCPNCQQVSKADPNRTFYDGYFYLFAYGIPNFYVESSYNVDLRQAFNNKEGDFWPHVSTSIPDEWVQESFVSIANDNTYTYNVTYSKQNKETFFTHIPPGFSFKPCEFVFPFRAIFSDQQVTTTNSSVNNWLTYRATSYFDFPQNYGKLTSLDGVDNRQVLARFENKSLLYNAMYTTQTNTGGQVYLGQSLFSRTNPPLDFGETDLGYVGSQHKFLLKIPEGQISIDAKRGQVFLLGGQAQAKDLSAPGSGMNRFFTDHLAFEILRFFPEANIDNNFNGLGLHGVYDSKYDRIIITKLDYIPLDKEIKHDPVLQEFYRETELGNGGSFRTPVLLSDADSFCNKSWTLSFCFVTNSWISFHSYLPNWYIGDNNFFYSGKKGCCSDFDFTFVVGELVPNPSTTTSTTTYQVPATTTSTTTIPKDCTMDGGTITVLLCGLAGTGIILIPTPPPPCQRPSEVVQFTMYSGYATISPPLQVNTSTTLANACNGKTYAFTNVGNVLLTRINFWGVNKQVGTQLFADNFSMDCVPAAAGFYYTGDPDEGIYEIAADGTIVSINPCTVSTTTTTTTCNLYLYDVQFFICGTCTATGTGTIGNSEFLPEDKYFYDPVTGFKMLTVCYKGCGSGTDRSIPASSAQDNCPGVVCAPVGTYYRYTPTISNCTSCASLLVIGDVINAQPLVVGKWYYDSLNNIRYSPLTFVGMDPGPVNANIDPATERDTCGDVICP